MRAAGRPHRRSACCANRPAARRGNSAAAPRRCTTSSGRNMQTRMMARIARRIAASVDALARAAVARAIARWIVRASAPPPRRPPRRRTRSRPRTGIPLTEDDRGEVEEKSKEGVEHEFLRILLRLRIPRDAHRSQLGVSWHRRLAGLPRCRWPPIAAVGPTGQTAGGGQWPPLFAIRRLHRQAAGRQPVGGLHRRPPASPPSKCRR